MAKPPWYRILEASRKVSGELNSHSLGQKADLELADASAWLCKFVKWGYARRTGQSNLGGKRIAYVLTEYGKGAKPPTRQAYTPKPKE